MNKHDRRAKKLDSKIHRLVRIWVKCGHDGYTHSSWDPSKRYRKLGAYITKTEDALRAITPPVPGEIRMSRCDYKGGAPRGYKCSRCSIQGVKLWRDYNTFLNHQELLCASCLREAAKSGGKDGTVNEEGLWDTGEGYHYDSFCFRVPAVPTPDGKTFWGYTGVPMDGVTWWRSLPTHLVPTT